MVFKNKKFSYTSLAIVPRSHVWMIASFALHILYLELTDQESLSNENLILFLGELTPRIAFIDSDSFHRTSVSIVPEKIWTNFFFSVIDDCTVEVDDSLTPDVVECLVSSILSFQMFLAPNGFSSYSYFFLIP